jgi:hypothetical protein
MNLVKYRSNPDGYLNMDYIESIVKEKSGIKAYIIGNTDIGYNISESAYNTILKYGKAEV